MFHYRNNSVRDSTIAMKTVNQSLGSDANKLIVGTRVSASRRVGEVGYLYVYEVVSVHVYYLSMANKAELDRIRSTVHSC